MTRTEIITRLCEIAAGLEGLGGQAAQYGTQLTEMLEAIQESPAASGTPFEGGKEGGAL